MGLPMLRFAVAGVLSVSVSVSAVPTREPASISSLCSLVPWPTARSSSTTVFVATALPDTVETGVGDVKPSVFSGHSSSGRQRTVYGQLFRIDKLGNGDSSVLSLEVLRSPSREVVIVPWDYDPACQPTYYAASARWVEPKLTGFFTVRIRPVRQWVAGRPTFDAFSADLAVYPHGRFFKAGYRGTYALSTRTSLTPTEFLSLYDALPRRSSYDHSGDVSSVRKWAAEHPDLANKYPADWILLRVLGNPSK